MTIKIVKRFNAGISFSSLALLFYFSACTNDSNKELTSTNNASYKLSTLWFEDNATWQNYHILLEGKNLDSATITSSIQKFKEENCTKQCNITAFSDPKAYELYMIKTKEMMIDKYKSPKEWKKADEKWSKKNWPFVCEHVVGDHMIGVEDVDLYPYMDFYYRECGGKETKAKLLAVRKAK